MIVCSYLLLLLLLLHDRKSLTEGGIERERERDCDWTLDFELKTQSTVNTIRFLARDRRKNNFFQTINFQTKSANKYKLNKNAFAHFPACAVVCACLFWYHLLLRKHFHVWKCFQLIFLCQISFSFYKICKTIKKYQNTN